jgi:hypothetical protein
VTNAREGHTDAVEAKKSSCPRGVLRICAGDIAQTHTLKLSPPERVVIVRQRKERGIF